MSRLKYALLSTALCAVAVLTPTSQPQDGWGMTLRTDRAFYTVGDTLDARFRLENVTIEDAFGLAPTVGGNGCVYSFTIEDGLGQTVWQPFIPCFFGTTFHELTSGRAIRGGDLIPLVYRNNINVGVQGEPLSPGAYTLCIRFRFGGPQRSPHALQLGTDYRACVPIRVEP